jgi:hypothetical protein
MSNITNELWREQVIDAELELRYQHVYSDYCKCELCKDARELRESDDYDLMTCHTV